MRTQVLCVARDMSRWTSFPTSEDQALARGFEAAGCQVVRTSETARPAGHRFDLVFICKLRTVPSWLGRIGPTAMFYGDYRPADHPQWLSHAHIEHRFTQFDDGRGIFVPPPAWCDDFDPGRPRSSGWLWTGQAPCMGDGLRADDVRVLPMGTPLYGWSPEDPRVDGRAYLDAIETHGYGLAVSHFHDVPFYTSDRLADYMAGGLTCAVRSFPGVETLVPPETFVYSSTQALAEFVADPTPQDPATVHAWARETFDGRVVAGRILAAL